MKKILIIGLGLIGSSIALGIKRANPDFEILGSDREKHSRNCSKAWNY